MTNNHRHYSNGEIIVHWKPELCSHSTLCVKNLPKVFDVGRRPWIDAKAAETKEIMRVVEMCPSGALSWSYEALN